MRVRDIARVELGAQSYTLPVRPSTATPAVNMAVYQTSGANALETMQRGHRRKSSGCPSASPTVFEYRMIYDTTRFVTAAIRKSCCTLVITFCLVVAVTLSVLAGLAGHPDPDADDPGVAGRHLRGTPGPGFQRQHRHPIRTDPRDRPGGGRRHRGGRERAAGHGGGEARPPRRPRSRP